MLNQIPLVLHGVSLNARPHVLQVDFRNGAERHVAAAATLLEKFLLKLLFLALCFKPPFLFQLAVALSKTPCMGAPFPFLDELIDLLANELLYLEPETPVQKRKHGAGEILALVGNA